jgi:hypothetical protein
MLFSLYYGASADSASQIFVRLNDKSNYSLRTFTLTGSDMLQRLLDHLKEATFYSLKDLEALDKNLQDCRRYVERGREEYSPHLLTLLDARVKVCEEVLADLRQNLSGLTPELAPKWDKLVSILRSLAGCNARSKVKYSTRTPKFETDSYSFLMTRLMSITRS